VLSVYLPVIKGVRRPSTSALAGALVLLTLSSPDDAAVTEWHAVVAIMLSLKTNFPDPSNTLAALSKRTNASGLADPKKQQSY
jgi:hypothetical protein